MQRLVVGLDPGTGKKSPTGFAAFDPDERAIIHTETVSSPATEYRLRYRDITERVGELLGVIDPDVDVTVACESFVMRGKAGEILARLTGALMTVVPPEYEFVFVRNTTVKRVVAGNGGASKEEVADAVAEWFGCSLEGLTPDETDALAIGLAAHLLEQEGSEDNE